jgi:opacity protein-like surface antigen
MKKLFAVALLAFAAGGALAQTPSWYPAAPGQQPGAGGRDRYFALRLGSYMPQHSDMDGFNSGFDGEVAFGAFFTPNLAAEVGIGYFQSSSDTVSVSTPYGVATGKAELTVIPVTATGKLVYPIQNVDLYALAGVGIYSGEMKATASLPGYSSASESSSDTAFGFHLGGGIAVRLTPEFTIGAELRYTGLEATFFDTTGHLDGLRIGALAAYRF